MLTYSILKIIFPVLLILTSSWQIASFPQSQLKLTRVTINKVTVIDHIFLKYNPETTYIAESIITDISYHYPTLN